MLRKPTDFCSIQQGRKALVLTIGLSVLVPCLEAKVRQNNESQVQVRYDSVWVAAPFEMPEIAVPVFPDQDYNIVSYGAKVKGSDSYEHCVEANTKAFGKAMEACHKAGGGRVVVPAGEWETGPIHFESNVDLHLEQDAWLCFTDNPDAYLPAVETTWEGYLCYNYSPLIYAYQCENIAITGEGGLAPKMDVWRTWFGRPQPHLDALKQIYYWTSYNEPLANRNIAVGESHLRPHLLQFNQCKHIRLEDFKIRQAPFWTIHMFRCRQGVVRRLDVKAHGHNNDGIDLEMTRDFLVEDCTFDQGDDAVVIKSGSNQDAWRLNEPTENVVVRHCTIRKGHVLLGVGSELSGGVRNVYMHDCHATGRVLNLFYLKTNRRRGGFIDHIYMERVSAGEMERAMAIDTDVLYQWRNLVPTIKDSVTTISHIYMRDVTCQKAKGIVQLNGDADAPIRYVRIDNLHVDSVSTFIQRNENVEDFEISNLSYDWFGNTGESVYRFKE